MLIWQVEESLPRIAFIECPEDKVLFSFPASGRETMIWAGIEIGADHIVTVGPRQRLHVRTQGPCRWNAISFSAATLAQYRRWLVGAEPAIPDEVCRWNVSPTARRELVHLTSVATRAIAHNPQPLTGNHTVHGLEQQFIHALVECLASCTPDADSDLRRRSQRVAVELERSLEESSGQDLKARNFCSATGVSERFLRYTCSTQLGMGFHSYRRLRQLQAVRRALSEGPAANVSIAEVAHRFGFCHPGTLASAYRQFFGELPLRHCTPGSTRISDRYQAPPLSA
jgi:AraC-like DNA-binding protein